MTTVEASLAEMDRGARNMIALLIEASRKVRGGEEVLTREAALDILTKCQATLEAAVAMVGQFQNAARQAREFEVITDKTMTAMQMILEQRGIGTRRPH